MPATIRVVGDLRRFAENDAVELDTDTPPGCSLGRAVDELVHRNPRLASELFDERGLLRYTSLLVLDGRTAAWPQDRDTPIGDGAEVVLTRFFSGG